MDGRELGVLRDGMTTALVGTALGAGGAYGVGRAMQGMVVGVGVIDPTAFALVACLVPASRAASVDPIVALRQE